MKTSIIILTKNSLSFTKKCLESLIAYTDNFELIIVDNGSDKETVDYLKLLDKEKTEYDDVKVIFNKKNMGSPYAWNQGIKIAKHD